MVECCFTTTETVGLLGTGAQDGHLDFYTAPEFQGAHPKGREHNPFQASPYLVKLKLKVTLHLRLL